MINNSYINEQLGEHGVVPIADWNSLGNNYFLFSGLGSFLHLLLLFHLRQQTHNVRIATQGPTEQRT